MGIVHLSDDDVASLILFHFQDSDNGIIENDPVPSMISVFVTCPESNISFFEKAIMVCYSICCDYQKQQRVGDVQIDLPMEWDSQRAIAFATWATKLGILFILYH